MAGTDEAGTVDLAPPKDRRHAMRKTIPFMLLAALAIAPAARAQQPRGYYDQNGRYHEYATQEDGYYDRDAGAPSQDNGYYDQNGQWHPNATNDGYYDQNGQWHP